MSEKKVVQVGGDINKSLNGEYHLDLRKILGEAWQLTQKGKGTILLMGLVVILTSLLAVWGTMALMGVRDPMQIPQQVQFGLDLFLTIVMAPVFAAIMMTAMGQSVGVQSGMEQLTLQFRRAAQLGLTALMISVLITFGINLFILPGIYLLIATNFALLLVAEKRVSPFQGILLSAKVVNQYLLDFIKVYCVFAALGLLVMVSFGLALIWVWPFYYHVKGVLYRDLFGIQVSMKNDDEGQPSYETVFHA